MENFKLERISKSRNNLTFKKVFNIKLVNCTNDHFPSINHNTLEKLPISEYICPENDTELYTLGDMNDPDQIEYSVINIMVGNVLIILLIINAKAKNKSEILFIKEL